MTSVAHIMGLPVRPRTVSAMDYEKVDWPIEDQLMGIEVEIEVDPNARTHSSLPNIAGWNKLSDGSLQYGVEYVLSHPLAGDMLTRAIHSFFNADLPLKRNTTSSTHIHIDMTEEETTTSSLQTLLALMYVLEPAIFRMVDPSREWCGFTNPMDSADTGVLSQLLKDKCPDSLSDGINSIGSRYYGVNVQALRKFGSLEFRYFPSATSAEEMIDWIKLVQCVKKASMSLPEYPAIIDMMFDSYQYEEILSTHFGKWKESILEHVPHSRARKRAKLLKTKQALEGKKITPFSANLSKIIGNGRFKKIKGMPSGEEVGEGIVTIFAENNVRGYRKGNVIIHHSGHDVPTYSGYPEGMFIFILVGDSLYIGYPRSSVRATVWIPCADAVAGYYSPTSNLRIPLSAVRTAKEIAQETIRGSGLKDSMMRQLDYILGHSGSVRDSLFFDDSNTSS